MSVSVQNSEVCHEFSVMTKRSVPPSETKLNLYTVYCSKHISYSMSVSVQTSELCHELIVMTKRSVPPTETKLIMYTIYSSKHISFSVLSLCKILRCVV